MAGGLPHLQSKYCETGRTELISQIKLPENETFLEWEDSFRIDGHPPVTGVQMPTTKPGTVTIDSSPLKAGPTKLLEG
jgi:hypothetical protein